MSRSVKRSPFVGVTTATTDKPWKRQMSRRARRLPREAQPKRDDWNSAKDGKQRFNPIRNPELLRK